MFAQRAFVETDLLWLDRLLARDPFVTLLTTGDDGLPELTRMPALYRRAALFVAPFVQAESGDQEGLPVALMEAVACGCPVVAGDVAGIEDLLGRMKPEICVDARNAEMLASCICSRLIDSSTAGLHAQAVLEEASRRVDWNRIAAGYARLIAQADDMK